MSSILPTSTVIMVSNGSPSGLYARTYRNELELVLSLIERSDISGSPCFGDVPHRAALRLVSKKIAETRKKIKRFNSEK